MVEGLPNGWQLTTIRDVTLPIEKIDPSKNPTQEIVYLDISGIDNKSNKIVEVKSYLGKNAPSRARQLVQVDDVLFSTVRTYLKNIALVPAKYDGQIASTGFSVLRAASGIYGKFLFHYSLSNGFLGKLADLQRGSSYPAIRDIDVRVQQIPLPPTNEQKRIVDKIEQLFSNLDEGESLLKKVQQQLNIYRQSVLKAAVTGELTKDWRVENKHRLEPGNVLLQKILKKRHEQWNGRGQYEEPRSPDTSDFHKLPEGWVWTKLEQLAFVTGGLTKNSKRKDIELKLPMLRVANVYQNKLILDEIHTIGVNASEIDRVMLRKFDMLIVEGNGSKDQIGRMAIWNGKIEKCIHQNHLIKTRFVDTKIVEFAMRWFMSPSGREMIEKVASSTSGLHTLSISKINDLCLPLPHLEELIQITDILNDTFSQIDALEQWCASELTRSATLRQSILKDAFTGKLVPQDPIDEPASELLKRIHADRSTTLKPPKQKSTAATPSRRGRPRKIETHD